ncbi:MAG: RHS repeat-associated core domain-containing protein [Pseudonocardiaceae bacterium]
MNQWQVLDLDGDPVPGDPAQTHSLATQLQHEAELAEHNTDRLRSVAANGGDLHMEGDYAPKFQDVLGGLPDELAKLGKAHRGCGDAVSAFATSLDQAKSQASTALRQGQDADGRYQGALREIRGLVPPDRADSLSAGLGPNNSLLEAAIASLDEGTKAQARAAAGRAQTAEQDRQNARRLANDAAKLRGDAETKCVNGINDALNDSGIKNKSWWQKAWDTISKPFRSWDDFINLCKNVAMVAGIAAMFISGPIGWALMAAALVAGAAIMADTAVKFAQGKAGLGDLAFAALGCIPGGRGVVSLARLGKGAAALAAGGLRGGKAMFAALRGGAIREGITTLRGKAVQFLKRTCETDPVDVATGEVVQQQTDLELPGVLPLVLTRTHVSSHRVGRWYGPSWASTLDQRLEVDPVRVYYAAEDGMLLVYPIPRPGAGPVWPEEGPRRPLAVTDQGDYTLTDPETGHTLHFAPSSVDESVLPLSSINDRNGNRIDLDYDSDGNLTQIRHSGGYRISVDTSNGLITALRLRGADNGTDVTLIRYRYNTARRLTEVINSSDLPLRFDYDAEGRMTRWIDRNDAWFSYVYDDAGRCTRASGSGGCLNATFIYHHDDLDNAVTKMTNSLGYITRYELNDANQVIRETNPLGHTTVSEWDRYDRLLTRTDPLGRTTRYAYDEAGNLIAITRPDGAQALADYNNLRLPVTVSDPDGAIWRQRYDERGNLTTLIDPAGATTTYIYNGRGHLTTVTDALGHTRQITTNRAGLPVTVTDPLGASTRYDRDTFGRVMAVTDPIGGMTRVGWTIEGKPAWRTLPDGATEHWTYDGEGNVVEYTDPLGQATCLEHINFDLPAVQIGPDGARLAFAYDTELRLITVTNAEGLTWRYHYDPTGNLVQEVDYNNRVLTYCHDAAGQLIERTNGAGQITRYTRDPLGKITEQRSGDSVTTFAYDPAGRLVHTTNADAVLTFERDPLGRVLSETCNGRMLTNTYDALGRRISRYTNTGAESGWEYDPNGQLTALQTAGHTLWFTRDPASREVERRLDTGVTLIQTWDPNYQLQSQTLSTTGRVPVPPDSDRQVRLLQRRSYTYRPDGYLTRIDDHLAGTRRFTLDPIGQATAIHVPGWIERYAYDLANNITHANWPAPPQTETLGTGAQGEREYSGTLIHRAGNVRYQHDAQGRITLRQQKRLSAKPRTWHYTWDPDDRLVAVTTPDGQRWHYRYDPLGRRIAKERLAADNTTVIEHVEFTWDGAILAEQIHTGPNHPGGRTTTWSCEPGNFRPLTQTERVPLRDAPQDWIDEQFYAIITDFIGTPTELVHSDGEIAWHPDTTLWGTPVTLNPNNADTPLRFPGQYYDPETELHYNYYRYYDPTTARYVSNDPLGVEGGFNPHSYVLNPISWLDPFGLSCKRGPKIWPFGPHNKTIQQRADELETQGYTQIRHRGEGGEVTIDTTGGAKMRRRPDIAATAPDGSTYYEQVGRVNKSGQPVPREISAMDDLERATGVRPVFTPYN